MGEVPLPLVETMNIIFMNKGCFATLCASLFISISGLFLDSN